MGLAFQMRMIIINKIHSQGATPMRFLCSKHERVYAQQPDEHLIEQWVTWMHSAGICYDCEDWVKAVSFVGSAYDLACIRLEKNVEGRADALAQITLSSIYLANIFQ